MGRNQMVSAHYHALGGVHGTELMFAGAAGIGTGTRTGTAMPAGAAAEALCDLLFVLPPSWASWLQCSSAK